MQQKAFEESRYPWQESLENVAVCLPLRCPRCGDHTRFRSLSSLRAHLEFSHSYEERTLLTKCSLLPPLKDTELVSSSELLKRGKLRGHAKVTKQKPSYVNLYSISHELAKDRKPFEVVAERPVSYVQTYTAVDIRADSLDAPRSSPGLPTSDPKAAFEAHVREKFNRMVEAVDRTIERRIDKLSKELARKTAELLEVRAAFVQLTQKKQEVQRRERALNRQVDVAVEMIAALKQRLTESEEELFRKEEEVVTFNHFLEAAAEKEVQGKARLQDFIENLLQRVELAEKQLEYYQSQQASGFSRDVSEYMLTDISSNRKPRYLSRGHPHSVCNHPELKAHFHLKGRNYLKKARDERAGVPPTRIIHEQAEFSRELCRPAKKGELVSFSRKGNLRPKMAKKKPTAIVNII
ncbi:protein ZNF365 [Nannospalax galili]|uniref:Zinc finger protein 365 n=1 Tax=Nannospalax galili TaxID=1026970 RepID=A0A8C6RQJ7_NANGA|nr:protein ZNF365 [Nannospalax galili]